MTDLKTFSFGQEGLLPQEEMLEIGKKQKKLIIGVPKERKKYENRIALTPQAVELLKNNGHQIIIEKGAGDSSSYYDEQYSKAGAKIVENNKEVYKCDIILKITPFDENDAELLKENQTVFSFLFNEKNAPSENTVRKLMKKKVTAIAYEDIKEENNAFPIIDSMNEIEGITSIMVASDYLSNAHNGKGVLLGGITGISPPEVVILGAGKTAEYAAKAAIGIGATVKLFDSSICELRKIQCNLSQSVFTSVLYPKILTKTLKSADVVISTKRLIDRGIHYIIQEDVIRNMKKGSVIIDLSVSQGGSFETTKMTNHINPVYEKYGIIHYCIPNIASRVSRTATIALSNIFAPMLLNIAEMGGIKHTIRDDISIRRGVYIYNGILTNTIIGNRLGISSKDINLLMAAL